MDSGSTFMSVLVHRWMDLLCHLGSVWWEEWRCSIPNLKSGVVPFKIESRVESFDLLFVLTAKREDEVEQ